MNKTFNSPWFRVLFIKYTELYGNDTTSQTNFATAQSQIIKDLTNTSSS